MFWTAMGFMGLAGLVTLFVVSTDGRYFGKKMAFLMYNQLGPRRFFSGRDERKWEYLMRSVDVGGEKEILDVGTAMGRLPMAIASSPDFSGSVFGVDWSPRMIAAARSRSEKLGMDGSVAFDVLDVRDGLPFDDGRFDVVFCLGLLETLARPDDVLAEIGRVTRPGGVIVLSAYHGKASWGYSLPYEWYLSRLSSLGLDRVRRVHFRNRYDFIIARTPDGLSDSYGGTPGLFARGSPQAS